jgi:ribose 5-phosphate isomerase B
MIYIGSDHGGYKLKEHLKKFLKRQDLEFKDLGAEKFKDGDDYPDYASKVAKQISKNPMRDQGILICRSGQGVCIAANKFRHIRATLVWNLEQAKMSRNDDMGNILCLPSDYISPYVAEHITKVWLRTPYSSDERHMRRIKKISDLEK